MGRRSLKNSECHNFKVLILLLVCSFSSTSLFSKEVLLDRLLAEVNGEVITFSVRSMRK